MRKRFSEQYGHVRPRESFQVESMSPELKNRIWNQIQIYYFDNIEVSLDASIQPIAVQRGFASRNLIEISGETFMQILNDEEYSFFVNIYDSFFKMNIKPSGFLDDINKNVKQKFDRFVWYEVYDFIEYVSEIFPNSTVNSNFRVKINKVLEEERSGYRFVDGYITSIIDEIEIKEIEEVFESEYSGVKQHLSNALEFLSDREIPNYPNSIKESISAVESMAKIIVGRETDLSKCLKEMDIDLNKQFKTALDNMYGWTNKEDGIRHGHTGVELKTNFEEAKFMLVTCSAFINYLIAKKEASES